MHRFAIDYLGLNLYPFQMIMIYFMNIMYSCCFICARGIDLPIYIEIYKIKRVKSVKAKFNNTLIPR